MLQNVKTKAGFNPEEPRQEHEEKSYQELMAKNTAVVSMNDTY